MYKKFLHKFLALLITGFSLSTTGLLSQSVEIVSNPGTSQNIVTGNSNYHVGENLYFNAEIGNDNFTTAATGINRIQFNLSTPGTPTSFGLFKVYMQNVANTVTTLPTANYSTNGYTLVYSGTIDAAVVGWVTIDLTTPFVRTAGSNLQVMLERLDGVIRTAPVAWSASQGDGTAPGTITTRRYNGTTAPVLNTTPLSSASAFRPQIRFIKTVSTDAALTGLTLPTFASCRTQVDLPVTISNNGTGSTPIGIGAASVALTLSGANSFTGTLTNNTQIDAGLTGTVSFGPISIPNPGITNIVAIVTLTGDGNAGNDTIRGTINNLATITNYPAVEDVDDTLPLFANIRTLVGTRNLWGLSAGYRNADMVAGLLDSLKPQNGDGFFLFDAWSGASSLGFRGIVHSRCLSIPPTTPGFEYDINFWMSHDTLYNTSLDSIYVVVSLDKGANWTRLQGFQRYSLLFLQPGWKKESVSLVAYAGQTIMLGFEGVSQYGSAIGIDNIMIRANNPLLPINLVNFTGIKSDNKNVLSWTTLTESNNSGFELQRSTDGFNFSKLGFIESKSRNGNSANEITYSFTDNNAFASGNYYRLKQLDKDGKSSLSNVVYIKGSKVNSIRIASVYPNPVINKLNLTVAAPSMERVTVLITDVTGKVMLQTSNQLKEGDNNLQLNVEGLAKGVYSVKVTCSNGCSSNNLKFVKQ